jgi:NAD(P) transhydrogenase
MDARASTGEGPGALDYDLIAIGSGPAGRGAALQAAQLGRRAAVVERQRVLGGSSTNQRTVPTNVLRAAIVEVTGVARGSYARAHRRRHEPSIDDLLWRAHTVIERERNAIQDELRGSGVDVLEGTASFLDAHSVRVDSDAGSAIASAQSIVIAVGTRPTRPKEVEFDDRTVLDVDGILGLRAVPRVLTVVGASVAGVEYASLFAALGARVMVVDERSEILDAFDDEIVEALRFHLAGVGVEFLLGETVVSVVRTPDGGRTRLRRGTELRSDAVIYAVGRHGAADELNLEAAAITADTNGRIPVDSRFRTGQLHIFAAGDITGRSGSSAQSKEQGRLAALAAFNQPAESPKLAPRAVYSIPAISDVGATERDLREARTPYVAGVGRFRELTAGEIAGDRFGFVKLLVHAESRELLGVHVFGTLAPETVHLGQVAMAARVTVDRIAGADFNAPTFADAFRLAAVDALTHLVEPAKTE